MSIISNHYQADTYIRETFISQDSIAKSFVHSYDHLNILASGKIVILVEGKMFPFTAPACITFKANIPYKMLAITDVVWYCIHKDTSELPDMETQET